MLRHAKKVYTLRKPHRSRIVTFFRFVLVTFATVICLAAAYYGVRIYIAVSHHSESLSEITTSMQTALPDKYPGVYEKKYDPKTHHVALIPSHSSLTKYVLLPDAQADTTVVFLPQGSTVAQLEPIASQNKQASNAYNDALARDKKMLIPVEKASIDYLEKRGFTIQPSPDRKLTEAAKTDGYTLLKRSDEACAVYRNDRLVAVNCQSQTLVDRIAILGKPLVAAYVKAHPETKLETLVVGQATFGSSKTPGYTYAFMPLGTTHYGLGGQDVFYSHNSDWKYFVTTYEGLSCATIQTDPTAKIALADICNPSDTH